MPKGYERMRDAFIRKGMSKKKAQGKAARIWNAAHPENPVTGSRHKKRKAARRMHKFFFALALLFPLSLDAQMVKGILPNDVEIPSSQFVRPPLVASEFDIPFDLTKKPGPGIFDVPSVSMLFGGRFVAWENGIYFFFGQVSFFTSCTGTMRSAYLLKNDNERQPFGAMMLLPRCDDYTQFGLSGMTFLAAGESVTFAVFQDSGGSLKLVSRACSTSECAPITWVVVVKVL